MQFNETYFKQNKMYSLIFRSYFIFNLFLFHGTVKAAPIQNLKQNEFTNQQMQMANSMQFMNIELNKQKNQANEYQELNELKLKEKLLLAKLETKKKNSLINLILKKNNNDEKMLKEIRSQILKAEKRINR